MSNKTMRIFFSLKIVSYPQYDYSEDDQDELSPEEAVEYEELILAAIEKENCHFENERGLEEYLDKSTLKEKVQSLHLSVEVLDGELRGVMTAHLSAALTSEETAALISQVEVQNSDGWGEGFKQRPIKTPDCELYVSFCNSGSYIIKTEQEMRLDPGQDGPVRGGCHEKALFP